MASHITSASVKDAANHSTRRGFLRRNDDAQHERWPGDGISRVSGRHLGVAPKALCANYRRALNGKVHAGVDSPYRLLPGHPKNNNLRLLATKQWLRFYIMHQ